jgi:hypothetical protein
MPTESLYCSDTADKNIFVVCGPAIPVQRSNRASCRALTTSSCINTNVMPIHDVWVNILLLVFHISVNGSGIDLVAFCYRLPTL